MIKLGLINLAMKGIAMVQQKSLRLKLTVLIITIVGGVALAQQTTLSFWQPPTSANADLEEQFWRETIAAFESEHPNIRVEFTTIPWGDIYTRWVAAIEANSVPDLTTSGSEANIQFAALGEVLPLDDLIEELGGEAAYYSTLQWYKWDDHYWGVPYIDGAHILFYRKDLFEEAGLPHPPQTWEELLAAAQELTVDLDNNGRTDRWGLGWAYGRNFYPNQTLLLLMKAFGGGILDEERNVVLNTPENQQALEFYTNMLLEHQVVPPGAVGYASADLQTLYGNGQIAMYTSYGIQELALERNFPEVYEKTGFAVLPEGPGGTRGTYGATNPIWIFKRSNHPEEAKEFIRFIMRPEIHSRWIEISGWVSPRREINERPEFQEDPAFQATVDSLDYAVRNGAEYGADPMNGVVEGQLVLVDMVQDVVVRRMSVSDALQKYQAILEEMYAR